MVPKITNGGTSFKSAFQYYLHDKGADTNNRIAWTQTENMRTREPDKAWKVMAYTAQEQERLKEASGQSRAGRKLEKPVFAFSLAWHPEQSPSPEHMLETSRRAIRYLGLAEHETMIVCHNDEPQKHVHVIVNRVHPISGLAGDVRNSKRKLSDFARQYEQENGKIYCERREANHQQRLAGNPTRYCDPNIVEAWESTSCGKSFVAALQARGYSIMEGRKRIVVIDPHGKPQNPTRHLKGVKAEDIRARLRSVDLSQPSHAELPVPESKPPQHEEASQAQEKSKSQQAASEQDISSQLAVLKEKQLQEQDSMASQQSRRMSFSKKHLAEFFELCEKKDEILALKKKLDSAPWWKKLLGFTHQNRNALREKGHLYKAAVLSYRERVLQITEQNEKLRAELRLRHDKERQILEETLKRDNHASIEEPQNARSSSARTRLSAPSQTGPAEKESKKFRDRRMDPPANSYHC